MGLSPMSAYFEGPQCFFGGNPGPAGKQREEHDVQTYLSLFFAMGQHLKLEVFSMFFHIFSICSISFLQNTSPDQRTGEAMMPPPEHAPTSPVADSRVPQQPSKACDPQIAQDVESKQMQCFSALRPNTQQNTNQMMGVLLGRKMLLKRGVKQFLGFLSFL